MVMMMLLVFAGVVLVAWFAQLVWDVVNGPTIDEAIKQGADKAWADFRKERLPNIIDEIVSEMIAEDPVLRFIKQIQWELARVDPSLSGSKGFTMAKNVYVQHLRDERAEFGDPRFGWDEQGAIELAHAYEIDYWDEN